MAENENKSEEGFDPFSVGGYAEEDSAAEIVQHAFTKYLLAKMPPKRAAYVANLLGDEKKAELIPLLDGVAERVWQALYRKDITFSFLVDAKLFKYVPIHSHCDFLVEDIRKDKFMERIADALATEILKHNPGKKHIFTAPLELPKGVELARYGSYGGLVLRMVADYDIRYDAIGARIDLLFSVASEENELCQEVQDGSDLIPRVSTIPRLL